MSEAALFATMTFSEIYERLLVGPLFRPYAEDLIARLNPASETVSHDIRMADPTIAKYTTGGALVFELSTNLATAAAPRA